jgi:hypothetical protein
MKRRYYDDICISTGFLELAVLFLEWKADNAPKYYKISQYFVN